MKPTIVLLFLCCAFVINKDSVDKEAFNLSNVFIISDSDYNRVFNEKNIQIQLDVKNFTLSNLNTTIPYNELLFWDGFTLFDSFKRVNERVHTIEYMRIYRHFKPVLSKYLNETKEFCAVTFRSFFPNRNIRKLPKSHQSFVLCFSTNETKNEFVSAFIKKYTYYINNKKNLLDMQLYAQNQHILLQFYDPLLSDEIKRKPPHLYTSFQRDGMVLQQSETDASKVLFSFRYDQILNCNGVEIDKFRDSLGEEVDKAYRNRECCVGLEVAWGKKPLIDMFCSLYNTRHKCQTDIKIFRASMFRACIATHVDKLYDVFVKNGRTLKGVDFSKFGVIERMKLANMAKQIKEWEIGEYIYDDEKLKKEIREIKPEIEEVIKGVGKVFEMEMRSGRNGNIRGGNTMKNEMDPIERLIKGNSEKDGNKGIDMNNENIKDMIKDYQQNYKGKDKDKNNNKDKDKKNNKDKDKKNNKDKDIDKYKSDNKGNNNKYTYSSKNKSNDKKLKDKSEVKNDSKYKKGKASFLKNKSNNDNSDQSQSNSNYNKDYNYHSNQSQYNKHKKHQSTLASSSSPCESEYSTEEWGPIRFAKDGITLISPSGLLLPVKLFKDGTTLLGPTGHVLPYSLSEDRKYFIGPNCERIKSTYDSNGRKRPWLTLGDNDQLIGADGKILYEENRYPNDKISNWNDN